MVRIALVEDDEAYQRQLMDYLAQYERETGENFQVSVFSDGDEIAENYAARYDIILMDIEMPVMDGMRAAEQIRKVDEAVRVVQNFPNWTPAKKNGEAFAMKTQIPIHFAYYGDDED